MKKWFAVVAVLLLVLFLCVYSVCRCSDDTAWVNANYRDYLEYPDNYEVCDAVVTGHFKVFDSLTTGWHFYTVVTVKVNGAEMDAFISRDMRADVEGAAMKVALPKEDDYRIARYDVESNEWNHRFGGYASCARLTPIHNRTNIHLYTTIAGTVFVLITIILHFVRKRIFD